MCLKMSIRLGLVFEILQYLKTDQHTMDGRTKEQGSKYFFDFIWITSKLSFFELNNFIPWVYLMRPIVIALLHQSVSSIDLSLNPAWIFLKLCMKLRVRKFKKWQSLSFVKNLNAGIKYKKIGFKWHFLWNQSLKVSNFVHDARGK